MRTSSEGGVPVSSSSSLSLPGGFGLLDDEEDGETEDWGGDLMDVNDDDGDWSTLFFLSLPLDSFVN